MLRQQKLTPYGASFEIHCDPFAIWNISLTMIRTPYILLHPTPWLRSQNQFESILKPNFMVVAFVIICPLNMFMINRLKNKQKHHCWCLRICESARYFIRPTSQASQASMAIVSLEASNTPRSCDFEGRDTPLISAWRSLSLETYGCSLKWLNCFTPTVSCRTRGTNRTGGWKLLPSAC